jgi:hypothetical protein
MFCPQPHGKHHKDSKNTVNDTLKTLDIGELKTIVSRMHKETTQGNR